MLASTRLLVLSLAVAFLATDRAEAQRRKLNGPLQTGYLSDATAFELASGRIVYTENDTDLLTVPLNGSAPVQPIFQSTIGFHHTARLTPDGTRVVLMGDLETPNVTELFSLPADGSGPLVKLSAPLVSGRFVYTFEISPDSEYVVYMLAGSGSWGPYSVRTDGSQPAVALNDPDAGGGQYQITADSAHVLFLSNNRLYTVPIAGGADRLRIHPALGGQRNGVPEFDLTPDGSRVVYRLDFDQPEKYELFSAPVDGSQPQVKLGPLDPDDVVMRFQVSPYSNHVSYVTGQALYGVPIGGGPTVQFSAGISNRQIREQRVTIDRTRMIYLANHDSVSRYDLYSVPVDLSQPAVNLTSSIPGSGVSLGFLVDPVSGRIVFRATSNNGLRLFSVEPDGASAPVELTPAVFAQGVPVGGFAIASGARAVFLTASVFGSYELYSAPLDGSAAAIRLHPPGGMVFSFVLDAEGGRALYRAVYSDDVIELFVVPVDGSAAPAVRSSIREHPSTVGDVTGFVLSPDGSTAIYQADQASGDGAYVVNLDGSPQPVWFGTSGVGKFTPDSQRIIYSSSIGLVSRPVDLSAGPTLITNLARLSNWWLAPDGSRVVHIHYDAGSAQPEQLFSTPVLGGPSVQLNTPNIVSGEVSEPEISPDSSRVVYAGIQDAPGSIELYSVPLVGGAAPVKLNGPLVSGGDVVSSVFSERPRISPDSSRVVYLADQNINNAIELFSVPIAGGVPPTELSALSAADRDVMLDAISPDSTRVVYVADQDANDVYELYSVPIAGGVPTELSAISAPDRDVESDPLTGSIYNAFLISPDSSWVVYVADQDANDVFEVYRAPLAGGAAPVRMTFDGTTSTTTYLLAITPDSQRVVYLRDQPSGLDYYSALLGGGSPVQLNGALRVTGENFEPIDPSGRWLAFQAAPHLLGVNELYVVPIRGGSPPVRVNATLASGSPDSVFGLFRPGGNGMVYRADQDEAGTIELYLNDLVSPRDDHHRPR